MNEEWSVLQQKAREGIFFEIAVPCYDTDLADRILDMAKKRVREDTIHRFNSLLQELDRKDKKLAELGVDPDLV